MRFELSTIVYKTRLQTLTPQQGAQLWFLTHEKVMQFQFLILTFVGYLMPKSSSLKDSYGTI